MRGSGRLLLTDLEMGGRASAVADDGGSGLLLPSQLLPLLLLLVGIGIEIGTVGLVGGLLLLCCGCFG